MGIIKAVQSAVSGGLADQWLEVFEPDNMGDSTVFTSGTMVRRGDPRGQNRRGTANVVSNGSVIHVYPNQFMMLVDGGKVVDYTAEEGYYTVNNSTMPSLFNGQFGDVLKESFNRIRFGGISPVQQKVYYINLQEIKGIKFGTQNPINYFDNFYNAELFLRAHGTYSIKIKDPLKFYAEAIPHNTDHVEMQDINSQYLSEFLQALEAAINKMSADGLRISYVVSQGRELARYMATILDEEWNNLRGMEIQAVGANISYDDSSKELINRRNEGAMLSDPTIREGYIQGAVARGIEAAGSNKNGSMAGFMGVGAGMLAGNGFMGAVSQTNLQQMQMNSRQNAAPAGQPPSAMQKWTCACGTENMGKFCAECGAARPSQGWTCTCGTANTGKFCAECGKPRPARKLRCDKCGFEPAMGSPSPKFCPECGDPVNEEDWAD